MAGFNVVEGVGPSICDETIDGEAVRVDSKLHMAFLDLEKVYGGVDGKVCGVNGQLLDVAKSFYADSKKKGG